MVKVSTDGTILFIEASDYQNRVVLPKETETNDKVVQTPLVSSGKTLSEFDRILSDRWQGHMENGNFRYGLDIVESRNIFPPG